MASLVRNIVAGILGSPALLHPRETQFVQGALGSLNAEIITDCDGCGTVMIDLRSTFSMTIELAGTLDGVNWTPIPVRPMNVAAKSYVAAIAGTAPGVWQGACFGYRKVRARVTAYTSGAALATLAANLGNPEQLLEGLVVQPATVTAAVGVAATLTLASPGAGLRHYLTYVAINRFAAALLTAQAVPVVVTTTNMPVPLAFSMPADAAAQGTLFPFREDFAVPIYSAAQNTATTIVAPATPNVIWRISAAFYLAP